MDFDAYYDWYKPLKVYSIIYSNNNDIWMCWTINVYIIRYYYIAWTIRIIRMVYNCVLMLHGEDAVIYSSQCWLTMWRCHVTHLPGSDLPTFHDLFGKSCVNSKNKQIVDSCFANWKWKNHDLKIQHITKHVKTLTSCRITWYFFVFEVSGKCESIFLGDHCWKVTNLGCVCWSKPSNYRWCIQ